VDTIEDALLATEFGPSAGILIDQSRKILDCRLHGDRTRWLQAISALPEMHADKIVLSSEAITAERLSATPDIELRKLRDSFKSLHPWRKGPFNIFGLYIDAEWRSNLKWARIIDKITPLQDRLVLDVGSGNGYYLLRMLGAKARLAVGIDPTQLFLAQFAAVNHYIATSRAFILPMKSEEWPVLKEGAVFDTVFSMGIYYHRRDGLNHLLELFEFLRPGGELVLETLVIDGGQDEVLVPRDRYAQMRNVWAIPTVARLTRQLNQAGFSNIELIDMTATTVDEQRSTEWMSFDSLSCFLDPADSAKTIEGYPAPIRATLIAKRAD